MTLADVAGAAMVGLGYKMLSGDLPPACSSGSQGGDPFAFNEFLK